MRMLSVVFLCWYKRMVLLRVIYFVLGVHMLSFFFVCVNVHVSSTVVIFSGGRCFLLYSKLCGVECCVFRCWVLYTNKPPDIHVSAVFRGSFPLFFLPGILPCPFCLCGASCAPAEEFVDGARPCLRSIGSGFLCLLRLFFAAGLVADFIHEFCGALPRVGGFFPCLLRAGDGVFLARAPRRREGG